MSNNDEGRFFGFNESSDVVNAEFDVQRLGALVSLVRASNSGSGSLQTILLLDLCLWLVLVEKLENLSCCVLKFKKINYTKK